MRLDVQNWAEKIFAEARHQAAVSMAAEQARQAKAGALGSSRSAFPMTDIYLEKSADALDQTLAGTSNQLRTRRGDWKQAFAEVDEVLKHQLHQGPEIITRHLSSEGSSRAIAEKHLRERWAALQFRLHAFRDGWTAPRSERWIERHPVWWGLITAAVGAALSEVVQF